MSTREPLPTYILCSDEGRVTQEIVMAEMQNAEACVESVCSAKEENGVDREGDTF